MKRTFTFWSIVYYGLGRQGISALFESRYNAITSLFCRNSISAGSTNQSLRYNFITNMNPATGYYSIMPNQQL